MSDSKVVYLSTDGDTINNISTVPYNLRNCMCGVFEITGSFATAERASKAVYLCTDIVEESIVGNADSGRTLPVLRQLKTLGPHKKTGKQYNVIIPQILWRSVIKEDVNNVRLYLADSKGFPVELTHCNLTCGLLVVPNRRS